MFLEGQFFVTEQVVIATPAYPTDGALYFVILYARQTAADSTLEFQFYESAKCMPL